MSHRYHYMGIGAVVLAGLASVGCHAYVEPGEPVAYTEVTAAPVGIESQPSIVYEGRPTYYYGDRWWYREPAGHWTYYRDEPEELRRHRAAYVQGAPVVQPRRERAPARGRGRGEREEHERGERGEHERPPVVAH